MPKPTLSTARLTVVCWLQKRVAVVHKVSETAGKLFCPKYARTLEVCLSWASLVAQLIKCLQCRRPWFDSWVRKIHGRKDRLPIPVFSGFPGGSAGKESVQCGRPGFDPWVGKIPWRRERLSTPVFWPGEFHGLRSLWVCKESDATERLSLSFMGLCSKTRGVDPESIDPLLFSVVAPE